MICFIKGIQIKKYILSIPLNWDILSPEHFGPNKRIAQFSQFHIKLKKHIFLIISYFSVYFRKLILLIP